MDRLHDIGDTVTVYAHFTSKDTGEDIDPSNVHMTFEDPSGTLTTQDFPGEGSLIRNPNVGYYEADIKATQSGKYGYRWFSTGDFETAASDYFIIRETTLIAQE